MKKILNQQEMREVFSSFGEKMVFDLREGFLF